MKKNLFSPSSKTSDVNVLSYSGLRQPEPWGAWMLGKEMIIEYNAKAPHLLASISFNLPLPEQSLIVKNNGKTISHFINPEYGADYSGILFLDNKLGKNYLSFETNLSNEGGKISKADRSDISVAINKIEFIDYNSLRESDKINFFRVSFIKNYWASYSNQIYSIYSSEAKKNVASHFFIVTNNITERIEISQIVRSNTTISQNIVSRNHFLNDSFKLQVSRGLNIFQISLKPSSDAHKIQRIYSNPSIKYLDASIKYETIAVNQSLAIFAATVFLTFIYFLLKSSPKDQCSS